MADEVVIAQGALAEARFVAAYGREGQLVAVVTFNQGKLVEFYQRLIEQAAPFPPRMAVTDRSQPGVPLPAAFPDRAAITHEATAILTGHEPCERRVEWVPRRRSAETPGAQVV